MLRVIATGILLAACGPKPAPAVQPSASTDHVSAPMAVKGLDTACPEGVTSISAGWSHTCALCKTTGEVACWGINFLGNLGTPLPTQRLEPARVPKLTNVTAIHAGSYHTCARLSSGQVTCWGANNDGQLGDDTIATRLHPVMVANLADVKQLDVGLGPGHTCAVLADGGVRCWGVNFNSQLGDGSMTNHPSPVAVTNLSNVTQVSTGAYHTCALQQSGKVYCWGGKYGRTGKLSIPVPREVNGVQDAVQIAAGGEHTCALRRTGSIACWGMNGLGQLGDGSWEDREAAIEVRELRDVLSIDAASNHTCAVTADRRVKCWGSNEHGQLGDGTTTPRNTPVDVAGVSDVAALSIGHRTSCAQTTAGKVLCWGELDRAPAEAMPR